MSLAFSGPQALLTREWPPRGRNERSAWVAATGSCLVTLMLDSRFYFSSNSFMFLRVPFSFTHTTLLLLIVWGVEAGLADATHASLVRLECCPLWGSRRHPLSRVMETEACGSPGGR